MDQLHLAPAIVRSSIWDFVKGNREAGRIAGRNAGISGISPKVTRIKRNLIRMKKRTNLVAKRPKLVKIAKRSGLVRTDKSPPIVRVAKRPHLFRIAKNYGLDGMRVVEIEDDNERPKLFEINKMPKQVTEIKRMQILRMM